jgi:hypothetical protein
VSMCRSQVPVFCFVAFALLGCTASSARAQSANVAGGYDVTRRRLIAKEAPRGWSNLVIKSFPRPGAGDAQQLSQQTTQLASFLFTAILADVRQDQATRGRYRLARLGVGMGANLGGHDMIISPETQHRLGANLGFLGRRVLSEAQDKLRGVVLVARSNTMGILDAPSVMIRGDRHRHVTLRYALLVDADNGRLDTLLWVIDKDPRGAYTGVGSDIEWLPANKLEDCVLHVDTSEFNALGIPSDLAFAMNRLPQGQKQVPLPEDLKALAVQSTFTPATARDLETRLRALLGPAPAAR